MRLALIEALDAQTAGNATSVVRFAGLVFDVGACTLVRESGEPIPLTRGEFRLLRLFVSRSGRVLSRDAILEAVANRPLELFDRSVDALVGRLRRKIEPDPKLPRLIATVPGEGYRFDGLTPALCGAIADGAARSSSQFAGESVAETATETARTEPLAEVEVETTQPVGAPPPPSPARTWARMTSWWRLGTAAALVGALSAVGAYGWRSGVASRFMGAVAEDKLAQAPRLSIVVLPFKNMSGDREQDYFADGITDDLTTDLSHLEGSFVISRSTAFTYRDKPVDAKQIGRELGVRYLLEGSVRRNETMTVNAQLISTETGAHLWADHFDGERDKLGDLQVEIVARLANSLGVELVKAEALRAMREKPENPQAADLAMEGEAILYSHPNEAALNNAVKQFERALALEPQNARAMRDMAISLTRRVNRRWGDDPAVDLARAEEMIDGALAIQPEDSETHRVKSMVLAAKREWRSSIAEAELAVALDRNNAKAHADASLWKMYLGRSEEGFAGIETAFRLSPRDSAAPTWRLGVCFLRLHLAQWDEAVDQCNRAVAAGPQNWYPLVGLTAANAWAGHDKEARKAAAQLQKIYPGFTVETWAGIHWSDDPTFNAENDRIVEGLRKAGLQDK